VPRHKAKEPGRWGLRLEAVSGALTTLGMVRRGQLLRGIAPRGGASEGFLALPDGCVTIVTLSGEGTPDLHTALLDSGGRAMAQGADDHGTVALHVCLPSGNYLLSVREGARGGPWVAAAWVGGSAGESVPRVPKSLGTCGAPIPLPAGVTTGSTSEGMSRNAGSCGGGDSREVVYELDTARVEHVTLEVEGDFDPLIYLRKGDCESSEVEVACDDDSPDRTHSRIDRVLQPGRYFLFVDGYGKDTGPFKVTVTAVDAGSVDRTLSEGAASYGRGLASRNAAGFGR